MGAMGSSGAGSWSPTTLALRFRVQRAPRDQPPSTIPGRSAQAEPRERVPRPPAAGLAGLGARGATPCETPLPRGRDPAPVGRSRARFHVKHPSRRPVTEATRGVAPWVTRATLRQTSPARRCLRESLAPRRSGRAVPGAVPREAAVAPTPEDIRLRSVASVSHPGHPSVETHPARRGFRQSPVPPTYEGARCAAWLHVTQWSRPSVGARPERRGSPRCKGHATRQNAPGAARFHVKQPSGPDPIRPDRCATSE